jgi:hypothetical protein
MSEAAMNAKFNLFNFTEHFWRGAIIHGYLPKTLTHQHVTAGIVIAEAYRQASEEIMPHGTDKKSFYEKQFALCGPDPAAEGSEEVYAQAIKNLDNALMSGPEWAERPARVFGLNHPKEGTPVTALWRSLSQDTHTAIKTPTPT